MRHRLSRLAASVGVSAALLTALVVASPATAAPTGIPVPPKGARFSFGSDAIAFLSTSGSTGTVYRNLNKVPYAAVLATSTRAFSGQFDGTNGGDVFVYNPGAGADGILHTAQSGSSLVTSFLPLTVNGTYVPVVGDFDGNQVTDVIWYAPGKGADSMWLFDATGGHRSVPLTLNGDYRPIVVDANGDGRADVLWYGVGTRSDMFWIMDSLGGHTTKAVTINGTYQPVVGPFGNPAPGTVRDRIVFYSSTGTDFEWVFDTAANHVAYALPNVNGNYKLIPGQFVPSAYGSIFFYGPGSLPEKIWAFGPGAGDVSNRPAAQVTGTGYDPQAGDYDANGVTDLVFTSPASAQIWKFSPSATDKPTKSTVTGIPGYSINRAIEMD
jgi:hypothetical protein